VRRLKVFIAYADEDKSLAGEYKTYLEVHCGFRVFVAHEDNVPARDWMPQIKENISASDVMAVLISERSKQSNYVNQEIGIAIGLDIRIFPFMVDGTPPFGFIDKIHGFPFVKTTELRIVRHCSMFFSVLTTDTEISSNFDYLAVNSVIYALSNSPNWKDTNVIINLLTETEKHNNFTKEQLTSIKSACCSNSEVYGGAYAYPDFKKLLETKYGIKGLV